MSLNEKQLEQMINDTDKDIIKLFNDESYAKKALSNAVARKKELQDGYNRDQKTPLRKKAFDLVESLRQEAASAIGAEFPKESELTGEASLKVMKIKREILKMDFHPNSEKAVRDQISSLYLSDDGVKYIAKDHAIMEQLWKAYYNRKGTNAAAYAQSSNRTPERDQRLIEEFSKNSDKYEPMVVQTVLSLLKAHKPEGNGEENYDQ